ncbi:AI-2E family transporter [Planosporangium mesophilum]|nr:AI-2E family transporter [Planosporangium mesophilum]
MLIHPGHTQPRRSDRLRAAGSVAWSLIGVALLVVAAMLVLMVLRPIVLPLLVALFLAIAFLPVVDALARRRVPRVIGAAAALLIVVLLGAGATLLVVWGIASQQFQVSQDLSDAVGGLHGILASKGVDGNVAEAAQQSVRHVAGTLVAGLLPAVGNLLGATVNVVLGMFVALFVCFFLLRDGHALAAHVAGWIPLPAPLGRSLLSQSATAIRRYLLGLTLLGVFNAVLVAAGALILHVPLVGAIAVTTLLGTYVPYVGAAVAGAFAVLIALGAGGQSTALWMTLVVFLANGLLQNLVTPIAYGATLHISPLVVLLATVLGGALAGVVGLALATPVAAVVARGIDLLRESRRVAVTGDGPPPADSRPAAPSGSQE